MRVAIHSDQIRFYPLRSEQGFEDRRMRLAIAVARSKHGRCRLRSPAAVLESDPDIADIACHPVVDSLDLDARVGGIADNPDRELPQTFVRLRHRGVAVIQHGRESGIIGEGADFKTLGIVERAGIHLAWLRCRLREAHMMNDPVAQPLFAVLDVP